MHEWAHVAVEWRPLKRDPARQAVHIYVNGLDQRNYRSTWWQGYSQKPLTFARGSKWLKEFLCTTQPDAPFVIDELRISSIPRYAKLDVQLGGQQIANPSRFDSPAKPFPADRHTTLLFRFNGNLNGSSATVKQPLRARLTSPDH